MVVPVAPSITTTRGLAPGPAPQIRSSTPSALTSPTATRTSPENPGNGVNLSPTVMCPALSNDANETEADFVPDTTAKGLAPLGASGSVAEYPLTWPAGVPNTG